MSCLNDDFVIIQLHIAPLFYSVRCMEFCFFFYFVFKEKKIPINTLVFALSHNVYMLWVRSVPHSLCFSCTWYIQTQANPIPLLLLLLLFFLLISSYIKVIFYQTDRFSCLKASCRYGHKHFFQIGRCSEIK